MDEEKNLSPSTDGAADASERPGAIVIRPASNADLQYDPASELVTDIKTGDRFGMTQRVRSGGIYSAVISAADGHSIYEYELKYGANRNPDKSIQRVIWQVLWAMRGEDARKILTEGMVQARDRAKHDNIERLAQFLRARRDGLSRLKGRVPEGETVIVDRRMDDTRAERIY